MTAPGAGHTCGTPNCYEISHINRVIPGQVAVCLHCHIKALLWQISEVGNSCHYQLNWKVDRSQSQLGHCGEASNLVLLQTVQ